MLENSRLGHSLLRYEFSRMKRSDSGQAGGEINHLIHLGDSDAKLYHAQAQAFTRHQKPAKH